MIPFYKASNWNSAPRRRGPAKILDIDDAGTTAMFRSHTFKVARYCARQPAHVQDVGEADVNPASRGSDF